jgi:hypothetical protein
MSQQVALGQFTIGGFGPQAEPRGLAPMEPQESIKTTARPKGAREGWAVRRITEHQNEDVSEMAVEFRRYGGTAVSGFNAELETKVLDAVRATTAYERWNQIRSILAATILERDAQLSVVMQIEGTIEAEKANLGSPESVDAFRESVGQLKNAKDTLAELDFEVAAFQSTFDEAQKVLAIDANSVAAEVKAHERGDRSKAIEVAEARLAKVASKALDELLAKRRAKRALSHWSMSGLEVVALLNQEPVGQDPEAEEAMDQEGVADQEPVGQGA